MYCTHPHLCACWCVVIHDACTAVSTDGSQSQRPAMATAAQKYGGYHISADPFSAYRLATFCDVRTFIRMPPHAAFTALTCPHPHPTHPLPQDHNAHIVSIWDTRHFSRPLFSLSRHPGNLLQLEWSTARSSCLGVLTTESPFLRFIDIPSGTEESFNSELYSDDSIMNSLRIRSCFLAEKGVWTRVWSASASIQWRRQAESFCGSGLHCYVLDSTPSAISSMNWHPKCDNLLLIAQGPGAVVYSSISDLVYAVTEHILSTCMVLT